MKRAILLVAALLAPLGTGCSSPCEDLAEKICSCAENRTDRDACVRRAQRQADSRAPSDADQDRCEALLDTCDCFALETAAGKRACGLAE